MTIVWPTVAILIPTYNRADVVVRTVDYLQRYLKYSGKLEIVVGIDGDDDTARKLEGHRRNGVWVLDSPRRGLGANLNFLSQSRVCNADYMIAMDDDHHLLKELNINRHVLKLMEDKKAGWIHLLMEARGDEHFDSYKFVATLDKDHYWRVHWNSPEHFIMSFRPHLFHRRWLSVMGMLPEGLPTGQTEWNYASQVKQRGMGGAGLDVLVPLSAYDGSTWAHDAAPVSWNKKGI